MGKASLWWLQKTLEKLKSDYKQKFNLDLIILEGNAFKILDQFIEKYQIKEVIWNRLYSKQTILRDSSIKKKLEQKEIIVTSFNSHLLNEPWEIKNLSLVIIYYIMNNFWVLFHILIIVFHPF